eukprot:5076127-Amphidinium_carterae.1
MEKYEDSCAKGRFCQFLSFFGRSGRKCFSSLSRHACPPPRFPMLAPGGLGEEIPMKAVLKETTE